VVAYLQGREDAEEAITELKAQIKNVGEDIAVDGLLAKYLKERGDADASQARLLRQLKRAAASGVDEEALHARLRDAGLPEELWLAMGAPKGEATSAGKPLADLLQRVNAMRTGAEVTGVEDGTVLEEMGRAVTQAVSRAEEQIAALTRMSRASVDKRRAPEFTRQQLLAIMAELGQELRQPLTVMNGVLDMMVQQHLGPVSDNQKPLLDLALQSGQRLDGLIDRMVKVAGLPDDLHPNAQIIARFS
ncbi:MAG: histidine kinase dimerization/phospho-acceptor domain-containing protein, partial [Kiritimatiellae bacterium]|nr:histidine kinase dimerization/phospho-acceptor domain-containing protein [Kiritimatiellia bacterium]